ncbi:hypothetical protein ACE1CI_14050 [Aerosakkonemataceae cyanobacterium BLCC-F50]|uniref:Uncharacterized protein n=1 Tax=Floridaenema flaviceps BLCC-F50 TaxID=3153642 RepID=A0ABV4XQM8_9CYAN
MTQAKQQYCKACGQPIRWVKTQSGKFTPIDPDGVSHWATCPEVEQFRSALTSKKKNPDVL